MTSYRSCQRQPIQPSMILRFFRRSGQNNFFNIALHLPVVAVRIPAHSRGSRTSFRFLSETCSSDQQMLSCSVQLSLHALLIIRADLSPRDLLELTLSSTEGAHSTTRMFSKHGIHLLPEVSLDSRFLNDCSSSPIHQHPADETFSPRKNLYTYNYLSSSLSPCYLASFITTIISFSIYDRSSSTHRHDLGKSKAELLMSIFIVPDPVMLSEVK